jgi:UDP-glucose 4-epimerase
VAVCFSDASLAQTSLNWRATLDIDRMCEDTWRWQLSNPNGYSSK